MSYLDPSVLGPSALHDGAGCVADRNSRTKRLRKSQSHGLLSPLLRLAKDPVGTLGELRESWTEQGKSEIQDIGEQRQVLYLRMKHAGTYDDWKAAATELDHIEGNDQWKVQDDSLEYNVKLLETRLKELDDARLNCDIKRMLFLIRTSLTRDLGGMGDAQLYRHSHIGTKALIERYIESSRRTIESLLEVSAKQKTVQVDPRQLLEQLLEARQAFGRSALLLSGGGTFGMSHIGVVKCLWEQKLLPRIVSGSSAGSIVCAVLCTKTDAEVPQVLNDFCYGDLSVFINEEEGLLEVAARFLKHGTVFDISNLTRAMRNLIGDITFQEAYNRTRRILNINVSSASLYELPQLLNYVTAPNVIIWSAVAASCSVPLVFSAASLLAKDPKTGEHVQWNPSPQRWIDGSVDSDLPMTRVAEMFNVNHFIVSQVNPHVVPFLDREAIAPYPLNGKNPSTGSTWLHSVANLAKDEAMHRMHVLAEIGVFPTYLTKLRSVLAQRYSGDITILPEISYAQFPRVLQNPTTEFMLDATISGERATWPKLSMIQNHVAIEIALDDAVQQLRARVVFSPSQVDLRI
ncbi:patatin-domain-containing protein, partial [Eremomyces bilateralis CBS 781.70]